MAKRPSYEELVKRIENLEQQAIEHKQAKKALQEIDKKYRLLVDTTPDWVWICDEEGRITFSCKAIKKILGHEVYEILGTSAFRLMHPEDRKPIQNWFQNAKEQKRGWRGTVVRWQHKDKSIRHLETIAEPIFDDTGNLVGFTGIDRDVTVRKQAEEAFLKREAELLAQSNYLKDVNTALKVLLKRREEDKIEIGENVLANVKELVFPYLEKLKKSQSEPRQETLVDIVESNLRDIVSPFATTLSSKYLNLTPTEVQVVSLIKHGRTTKEIAALLHLSMNTIRTHRSNIRSKLGLKNKKMNLRSYLSAFNEG